MLGFSPLATRPLAGPASQAAPTGLAGAATMMVAAVGAISLAAAVPGATTSTLTATGAPAVAAGLSGAATSTLTAYGDEGRSLDLSGAAAGTLGATGAAGRSVATTGDAENVLTTSGGPTLTASLAGSVSGSIGAGGVVLLSAGVPGAVTGLLAVTGAPAGSFSLGGAAVALLGGVGAPTRGAGLGGQGGLTVGAAGEPGAATALAGGAYLMLASGGQFGRFGALASYSADDYLAAFQALLPRGPAWPRETDALQTAVFRALAQSVERLDADANELISNLFPGTSFTLLDEWEATVDLPDQAAGPAPSTAKRQRAVAARLAGSQGFSRNAIRTFCGVLGYDVALFPLNTFRVEQATVEQGLADEQWANTVAFNLTPSAAPPFSDALTAWDLAFCISGLRRMAPAHLALIFNT